MKILIFKFLTVIFICIFSCKCSEEKKIYSFSDFNGKIFISEVYGVGTKAELQFSHTANKLTSTNMPLGNFSKKYQILDGNMSPSGRPTIVVDGIHYFIIDNRKKLIYRYYYGMHEKTIIFREN